MLVNVIVYNSLHKIPFCIGPKAVSDAEKPESAISSVLKTCHSVYYHYK